jgi:hypothetical protein
MNEIIDGNFGIKINVKTQIHISITNYHNLFYPYAAHWFIYPGTDETQLELNGYYLCGNATGAG